MESVLDDCLAQFSSKYVLKEEQRLVLIIEHSAQVLLTLLLQGEQTLLD